MNSSLSESYTLFPSRPIFIITQLSIILFASNIFIYIFTYISILFILFQLFNYFTSHFFICQCNQYHSLNFYLISRKFNFIYYNMIDKPIFIFYHYLMMTQILFVVIEYFNLVMNIVIEIKSFLFFDLISFAFWLFSLGTLLLFFKYLT